MLIECSVRLLLLISISLICVNNVYCGFNGTNIEPRSQNPINHPFMLWNHKSFVCMTCFNESGEIYYYHPGFQLTSLNNSYVKAEWVADGLSGKSTPQLIFNHLNKTFSFYNGTDVSIVGTKFKVNQSLYFDNLSPYYLSVFNVTSNKISEAYMMWNNRFLFDLHAVWLRSPINTTIVLGDLFQANVFRFINYRNATVSPHVALRANLNASLGYPRYFPSTAKQQVCPTKSPVIVTQPCKPEIKTVTVIKEVEVQVTAKAKKSATIATPSESPQLIECKQQLNIFVVLFMVALCLFLLVLIIIMCRYTNKAQTKTKSSVY
uniref:Minor M protein 2 n=1 Tax=Python nidovirus TaxID=1526652 RepID=A0A076E6X5_9NIDO|nr:minor M protein 2 [Python nidovirus]